MTKYRILPARTRDRSRNGTALLCVTRLIIDLVAGDAAVRTVGADVRLECPRCLGRRDNGTYDWSVPLRKLKNDQSPAASMRSTQYLVIPVYSVIDPRRPSVTV